METIGKLANQVSVSEQKPLQTDTLQPYQAEILTYLWREMTFLYRRKWTADMGEDHSPNGKLSEIGKRWVMSLSGLTRKQIAIGISTCAETLGNASRTNDDNDLWPPSYVEFRALCKPIPTPAHKPFEKRKALANPATVETARSNIEKMREALR